MYPAEHYFTVDANTGVIRTYGDLKNDPLKLMSYTVSMSNDPHRMTLISMNIINYRPKLMSTCHDPQNETFLNQY